MGAKSLSLALVLTGMSLAAFAGEAVGPSLREQLLAIPLSKALGGDTTRPLVARNAFSFQVPNAPRRHQRPFSFGNRLFNTNWVEAPASVKSFDGLGPVFNRVSCSGCHIKDGRGSPPPAGKGPMDSMLLRVSIPGEGPHGGPKPVPGYGDQLSERGIAGVAPEGLAEVSYEEVPGRYGDGETYSLRKPQYRITETKYGPLPADVMISPRVAPQVIGLGLLEAVPEAALRALTDPDDRDGDGISGRINKVWDSAQQAKMIGRFGWKAGQPDLLNQNASAAIGDIGLTTSLHRIENCSEAQTSCRSAITGGEPEMDDGFLEKLTLYTASLSVPAQRNADAPEVKRGGEVFRALGCASCHMPTLRAGHHARPELAGQTFHPFTDLLLHDMGPGLADNRPEFEASGSEWRTPPLWSLGLVPMVNGHDNLLHDGRARGFAEAILWHGGEAEAAKEAFRNAPKDEREALIAFLKSL
ncbi:MAG: thiol oxidoreductase [Rhizobiales bacterium]|nr:thiol oxidoreductase [Hyphomicrobiales bacterium]